eukprot:CAMPEP_0172789938 /NCGR_PEP_ID=MMETSP1074-20121228/207710_1 /TAXON_ID=2916 /ORGANISM="Ceratium fusus, Strain PA161109" /LENGTH=50 /DNA_ID=CAMNT_0013626979 /DNA_START=1399 /DNA_END=1548 /DNA_ORIENTATION=+
MMQQCYQLLTALSAPAIVAVLTCGQQEPTALSHQPLLPVVAVAMAHSFSC